MIEHVIFEAFEYDTRLASYTLTYTLPSIAILQSYTHSIDLMKEVTKSPLFKKSFSFAIARRSFQRKTRPANAPRRQTAMVLMAGLDLT